MSLRKLPKVSAAALPAFYSWDARADALSHWAERPLAAASEDSTISIYDVVGEDWWSGEGFTSKKMAGILRSIGPRDVTVKINSPGGDMFEGLAIYNQLAEHPGKVTVKVMGIAASAASIIAMAGDEVLMGEGTTMMIHRAWGAVIGNYHDFAAAAPVFDGFDRNMAAIYAGRTGKSEADIIAMLDGPTRRSDGTYLTAAEAIEQKFADGTFDSTAEAGASARAEVPEPILARRRWEARLAHAGFARKQRDEIFTLGQRDATRNATRDAGGYLADVRRFIETHRK